MAAVSYQCAATWRWLKALARREPSAEESAPISKQPSIRISHSLPDIQKDVPNTVPEKEGGKKVLRQTTLPTVPSRHQTFQRQLSHRFDLPCVQFSICRLEDRNDSRLGLIKVSCDKWIGFPVSGEREHSFRFRNELAIDVMCLSGAHFPGERKFNKWDWRYTFRTKGEIRVWQKRRLPVVAPEPTLSRSCPFVNFGPETESANGRGWSVAFRFLLLNEHRIRGKLCQT